MLRYHLSAEPPLTDCNQFWHMWWSCQRKQMCKISQGSVEGLLFGGWAENRMFLHRNTKLSATLCLALSHMHVIILGIKTVCILFYQTKTYSESVSISNAPCTAVLLAVQKRCDVLIP